MRIMIFLLRAVVGRPQAMEHGRRSYCAWSLGQDSNRICAASCQITARLFLFVMVIDASILPIVAAQSIGIQCLTDLAWTCSLAFRPAV